MGAAGLTTVFGVARPGQLREELPALDLPVVGYHVLPTAADAGMMEVVADSKTIYEITARREASGGAARCGVEASLVCGSGLFHGTVSPMSAL